MLHIFVTLSAIASDVQLLYLSIADHVQRI